MANWEFYIFCVCSFVVGPGHVLKCSVALCPSASRQCKQKVMLKRWTWWTDVNRCEPYLCKCQHIVHIQYSVLWFVILPNMSKYNGHHNTQLSIEFTWKLAFQWCEDRGLSMADPFPNPKRWQCQRIQQTEKASKHKSYFDILTLVAEGKTKPSHTQPLNQLRTCTMPGPATAKSLLDLERQIYGYGRLCFSRSVGRLSLWSLCCDQFELRHLAHLPHLAHLAHLALGRKDSTARSSSPKLIKASSWIIPFNPGWSRTGFLCIMIILSRLGSISS